MSTEQELFEEFATIEDNVLNNIVNRPPPCPGPLCDTSVEAPPGYICIPCGGGPNQGYLARDAADIAGAPAPDNIVNVLNAAESLLSGDTPKEKFILETLRLINLELQISEKIKELNDLQKLAASMRKIINKEVESLV